MVVQTHTLFKLLSVFPDACKSCSNGMKSFLLILTLFLVTFFSGTWTISAQISTSTSWWCKIMQKIKAIIWAIFIFFLCYLFFFKQEQLPWNVIFTWFVFYDFPNVWRALLILQSMITWLYQCITNIKDNESEKSPAN